MHESNPYFEELEQIHVEIAALFNGTSDAGALDRVMAHFSPQASVVMPSGVLLDWTGLREILAKAEGQRPVGFRIAITDMKIVARHPAGAVVTYREQQDDGAGNGNIRRSTAVFELDPDGNVRWRHLQETFCAS